MVRYRQRGMGVFAEMGNPLTDVLPDRWRKIGYAVMFTIGTGLGGVAVAYATIGGSVPKWVVFALAFYGAVAGPSFAVPASNVK